ncbi:MAG: hypothetical protein PHF35_00820 [Candidatus Moranbacteria bacterium]|nr:hypothetical protein [Candidatus Moranbacteria bacterium]
MTEKRIPLEEINLFGQHAEIEVMKPKTPINSDGKFQQFIDQHQKFLQKSAEDINEPLWNSHGECPKCKSKQYFLLYGGNCDKKCSNCGKCYDCRDRTI